jgi:PHD/YefM family antitoxin component YafN of YafNO toxin-antitoxin module
MPDLRQAFEEAEVVLFATLGESLVGEVDREAQIIEVQTKLHVAQVFKGEAVGRTAIYRHWIGWSADNEVIAAYLADFAPGTEVLAILNESEERVGLLRKKAYESFQRDLEVLSADTKAAYLDRLKALVAVGKDSEESELGPEPAALAEWLVATAEDPSTRGEATAELAEALETLQKFVQEEGRRPEGLGSEELLIAAALDDRQKARLSEALLATDRFNEGDRGLFTVVQSWDSDLALDWLINQLRRGEPVNLYPEDFECLPRLARQFEASEIQAFADVAEESLYALWEPLMDDDSAASKRRYEEESEKLGRELMVELADLLERR